jgi:hypothetical protein
LNWLAPPKASQVGVGLRFFMTNLKASMGKLAVACGQHPILLAVASLALLTSLVTLVWGVDNSVVDAWDFRQAQTGLSAYWMTQGGDWFAYETPVSGHPWTIPFEFPTYQWLVALAQEAGMPMNASGRLVSWLAFVGCLVAGWTYLDTLKLSVWVKLTSLALVAAAPLYLFFSRAILIESTALLLSLLYLLALHRSQQAGAGWLTVVTLLATAVLAATTKITTFFPFALLGGLRLLHDHSPALLAATSLTARLRLFAGAFLLPAISVLFGVGSLLAWLAFADALKEQTPYGAGLTSGALAAWNFGFPDGVLNAESWANIVWGRTLPDLFGSAWLAVLLAAISVWHRQYWKLQLALIAVFILTYGVFWNLHIVHDYYQYANGVFLLLAGALALDGLRRAGWSGLPRWVPHSLALCLLVIICAFQIARFVDHFGWGVRSNQQRSHTAIIARLVEARTDPEHVAIVFGYDWNSVIAYESRRRVITVPAFGIWAFEEKRDLTEWTGGREIDVVVDCDRTGMPLAREFIDAAHGDLPGYRFLDCTVWDRVGVEPDVMEPPE